jgi:hypothetical protein
MSTAVTTSMNFLGNALDSILHDPQAGRHPDLAVGAAFDVLKSTPVDMFSSIPHYELQDGPNESPALPGSARPSGG